jgi:hypothetical protein
MLVAMHTILFITNNGFKLVAAAIAIAVVAMQRWWREFILNHHNLYKMTPLWYYTIYSLL